ncbi:integrin alpha [Nitrosomonas ureae]|uniref:FG-GAP repeat protein n=1 Tax=Nitrosomonas ureae TaxID=44577 RepID=A0A2T5IHC5_9PROT|nr:integrin alpha [Nitrosomonas ureae]PTQ83244.1 FG-GAP repeat protein [Nitrosomonas ureae]
MTTASINLSNLDGSNGFRLDGETVDVHIFQDISVSNAGDVNGDGFDDVIIGTLRADPNSSILGSSYVVFGKASGFDATLDLSNLNGSDGFRLDGETVDENLLHHISVSGAGDVNGDGFDDVIIGVCRARDDSYYSGSEYSDSSYVVFGKASGFDATMNLSNLDGSNGFRLDGDALRFVVNLNVSVSSAGDVNGDGFDDVIIGTFVSQDGGVYGSGTGGSNYVIFGKASGFDATMNLSDLVKSRSVFFQNIERMDDLFLTGVSVSNAGDVNGDGFDDVIIVTNQYNQNTVTAPGYGYVVFGTAPGIAMTKLSDLDGSNGFRLDGGYEASISSMNDAGDVNGDGFDDVIVGDAGADLSGYNSGSSYVIFGKASGFDATMNLSDLDGSNGFRLDGETENDRSGVSVSSAGDVNGDGFDDVIVGAFFASSSGLYSGSSYVVFGKASGFDATMNLSDLNGSNGFRLDGEAANDRSGRPVSSAGDVNGDGFDDLIVSAVNADSNGIDSGSSYIIFGRSDFTGGDADFQGTPGDDNFTGTKVAESFKGEAGNDRLIGRGGADSFDAGDGNDYIRILGDDFQFVDGGSGIDTLGLAGSDFNLDLSSVIDKIHGIETIALYGVGDNTLALTAQDVTDLSDSTNTLRVKGNAGDSMLGLNSGWTDGGVHGNFHTYTQGEAVLLVGVDVATDFPIG